MKNQIPKIGIIFTFVLIISSCGVSTKNKRQTVTKLKCYDRELFDFRKKYEVKKKQIDRKNKKFLRKNDRVK